MIRLSLRRGFTPLRLRLRRGFTLIELLLVIGIIAILASIVIIAINPTRQLGSARDAQRRSDVNTILNAVYQYAIDNSGSLPETIPATATEICKYPKPETCTGVDLTSLVGNYLVSIPSDPQAGAITTGYKISKDATTNRITVSATPEVATTGIAVTR